MFRIRNLVDQHRQELAALLTAEHGKVPSDALGEIARGLENLEFATAASRTCSRAASASRSRAASTSTRSASRSASSPASRPFNFPAMVPMWMFATAIACGNTFILKPSEKDPSASIFIAELLAEAGVPDGVFNVVHGDKVAVDASSSTPTSRRSLRRLDADRPLHLRDRAPARQARPGARRREEPHDRAARRRHRHGRRRRGLGRLRLVRRALHGHRDVVAVGDVADPLVEAIKARLPKIKVGPGTDPTAEMGPLVTRQHRDKVASYLDSGPAQGATVVADGREHPLYKERTASSSASRSSTTSRPTMDAYRDEIFGPVLTVVRVETYDEAVQLVNDNPYGNGTAIFTRDGGAARQFQFEVKAGMVGINVPIPVPVAYYSFGGWKASLFGDLHMYGPEGIQFYTRAKVVTSRWPDPGTSQGRPRLPAHPLSRPMTQTTPAAGRRRPRPQRPPRAPPQPRPGGRARRWPATDYTSEAVYAEERERVWFGGWVCVGRAEEIPTPGDYLVRDIAGESSSSRATRPASRARSTTSAPIAGRSCSTRPASLRARQQGLQVPVPRLVVRPRRAGSSGRPTSHEDEQFDRGGLPAPRDRRRVVRRVPVRQPGRGAGAAGRRRSRTGTESITNFDRYRMDELRIGVRLATRSRRTGRSSSRTTTSACTARRSIPELVSIVPLYRFGEVWDEETHDDGNWMIEGATSFTRTGHVRPAAAARPRARRLPHVLRHVPVPEPDAQPPPGLRDVLPALPAGPGHTTVISEFLFRPETIAAASFKPDPVVELWDLISKQDWAVCERAQTGVGSRAYKSGVYPRKDRFLFDFNERYRREMGRPTIG